MLETMLRFKWVTGMTVGVTLVGIPLAFMYGPEEWGVFRKVAAGLLMGFLTAFTIVTTRMLGAFAEGPEDGSDEDR